VQGNDPVSDIKLLFDTVNPHTLTPYTLEKLTPYTLEKSTPYNLKTPLRHP